MIYGPFAFTAGILLANGSELAWLGLIPLFWFVGMVLSHVVFGKCVLNVLTSKLKKVKGKATTKSKPYQQGWAQFNRFTPRCKGGEFMEILDDEKQFPKIEYEQESQQKEDAGGD